MRVIFRVKGGLGNQLFQYAKYLSLEGCSDKIYIDSVRSNVVRGVSVGIYSKHRKSNFILNIFVRVFLKLFFILINFGNNGKDIDISFLGWRFVDGYWITTMVPSQAVSIRVSEVLGTVGVDELLVSTVAVHVRCGDYLSEGNEGYQVCTESYFRKALSCISEKQSIKSIVLFSDDAERALQILSFTNIPIDIFDNDQRVSAWETLKTMSRFPNIIICNSTFSWWAAYIDCTQKNVVSPERWHRDSRVQKPQRIFSFSEISNID